MLNAGDYTAYLAYACYNGHIAINIFFAYGRKGAYWVEVLKEADKVGIVIRKALPKDAYEWAVCRISCWQSAYKGIYTDEIIRNMPLELNQHIEKYTQCFQNPGEVEYYSVIYSSEMIGSLVIDKAHCEVWAIYLKESFWGKGCGREVMDFAVKELAKIASLEISLWVFEKNSRARRFYEKYGFKPDGAKKESDRYGIPLIELRYVYNKGTVLLEGSESKKFNFPDPYYFGAVYCPIFPPRHKTMKAVLDNIPETIETVYVFGSSIRFDTGIDSDLDVLLIGELPNDDYNKICKAVPKGEKLDLLVETKERFLSLLDDTWSSLYRRIYLRGYKIYER